MTDIRKSLVQLGSGDRCILAHTVIPSPTAGLPYGRPTG